LETAATEAGPRAITHALIAFGWKDFDFVRSKEFCLKIVVHLGPPDRGYI
jgi:hypothetical protein